MRLLSRGGAIVHSVLSLTKSTSMGVTCEGESHEIEVPSSSFPPLSSPTVCQHHTPPPTVDYANDPTVFGRILEGSLPTLALLESESLLAFQDQTPRAPLHALVIPKKYIPTVNSLEYEDLPLLNDAHTMALALIEHYYPQAHQDGDYILAYHVPPFNSVDHLHMHVLAPASEMGWMYRYGKYQVGTCWCTDEATERQRLEKQRQYTS